MYNLLYTDSGRSFSRRQISLELVNFYYFLDKTLQMADETLIMMMDKLQETKL